MSSMKVLGVVTAAAVMATPGLVQAADEGALAASLDLPVLSAYVWRGQVLNDEAVLQPGMTVSKKGFVFSYWGNFNLTDAVTGDAHEFSEHDIGVAYNGLKCPVTGAALTLGVVNYDFPNQAIADQQGAGALVRDTHEAYVAVGFPEVLLAPTVQVNYDFKEADGFYFNAAISHSFELAKAVSLDVGANVGYASSDYNEFYFGVADDKFNDGNVSLSLPWTACANWTFTPAVAYTWLLDSDIEDAANALYLDKDQVVGSLKATYTF
jgi:uncharacterized protein (TIGR02001 family)